jgi:hypothetical protein
METQNASAKSGIRGVMSHKKEIILSGWVTDVSPASVGSGYTEQVTFSIEDAVPLWAEVRVQNRDGWVVGDQVSICIVCAERDSTTQAA